MGRKKRNGMKMPPRGFKKFLPKEKAKRMASRDDLSRIDQDLHAVRMEAKAAVDKFNDYARAVAGQIKEILEEAGVYEEVSAIEKSRDDVRKTLEGKLKGLQEKVNELLKIRAYLEKSVETASAAPVEPSPAAPEAPAPAPVEEAAAEPVAPQAPVEEAPAPAEKKAKGGKKEKAAPAPAPVGPEPAPAPAKKDRKPVEPPKF